MMIKMLTRVQNIFLATKNIEETSRKFSTFFRGNPNFEGSSENLGVHITVFGLDKTNICLISPMNSGIWFKPLTNFLREKGEGIFGLNFSSDDIDNDYKNFKINDLKVSSRFNSAFQENTNDTIDFNFFNIVNESVSNLNISISNEINFLSSRKIITDGISKVNQLVIQTKFPEIIKDIFEEKLNIRLALDKTFKEWAGRMLFFRLGGVTLEIIEGRDLNHNCGYFGIGWHTDNYSNCYKRLIEDGFGFSEIRKGRKKGTLVSTLKEPMLNIPTILIGLEE